MLSIWIGRAGAGKSRRVLETMARRRSRRPQVLLVPEHISHEAEVDLCRALGPTASRDAEVLSFQSLGSRVLARTGGLAEFTLDGGGKLLTMRLALQELHSRLKVFGRPSQQAAVGLAVRRSRDEHDVADACHQQHAQRIIDHRLVIDRDQGFGNGAGHGVQAAALAASENDTFHPNVLPMMLNMICKPGYHGARTVVFPPGTYDTFAAGLPPASG